MATCKVHAILPQQPTAEAFLTNRTKSLEKSVPKGEMGVWDIRLAPAGVGKVFGLTELHHSLQTGSVRSCPPYTHKRHGGPETLASFYFFLVGNSPLAEAAGSEHTDQKNLMKLDSSPSTAHEPSYQDHMGLLSSSSYSGEQVIHWPGWYHTPHSAFPLRVLEVFPCWWTHCSELGDCTYLAFLRLW